MYPNGIKSYFEPSYDEEEMKRLREEIQGNNLIVNQTFAFCIHLFTLIFIYFF